MKWKLSIMGEQLQPIYTCAIKRIVRFSLRIIRVDQIGGKLTKSTLPMKKCFSVGNAHFEPWIQGSGKLMIAF